MDILSDDEIDDLVRNSRLISKYNETIDRESAYEMLNKNLKYQDLQKIFNYQSMIHQNSHAADRKKRKALFEKVLTSSTTRQIGNTVVRELARGILGVLGPWWFNKKKKIKTNAFGFGWGRNSWFACVGTF